MKRIIGLLILAFGTASCGGGSESRFPLERTYWTPQDYDNVIREIDFNTPVGERYPEFSKPETAPVISKIVDHQNYLVVFNDEALGLNHRKGISDEFFDVYRKLNRLYDKIDRQDRLLYSKEYLEIEKWGYELQLYYFKLGNDIILNEADDPESSRIKNLVSSNERTLFNNYNIFIGLTDKEEAFADDEIDQLSKDLVPYYQKLIDMFPNGNFDIPKKKAELMLKKVKDPRLVDALNDLNELLTNKINSDS